jgi:hypothetical protein
MSFSQRRSCRQTHIKATGVLSQWRHLNHIWRQHYIDLGHGRIARCKRRLQEATATQRSQLKGLGLSFVALAITSAASVSGRARVEKEMDLSEYIRVAIHADLNVNDDHNGEGAVCLAAYHGLTGALTQLLDDEGCPLRKNTRQDNPIFSAIRNGQHDALEIILSKRTSEAIRIISEEETIAETVGKYHVSLQEVIMKVDVTSAQLLLSHQCVFMSDRIILNLYKPLNGRLRHWVKLEKLLRNMYPNIPNVKHWCKELHWSFPTTDRQTMNWLWYVLHCPSNNETLPSEAWLRVFSYFGRGWFACRRYDEISMMNGATLSERNIID